MELRLIDYTILVCSLVHSAVCYASLKDHFIIISKTTLNRIRRSFDFTHLLSHDHIIDFSTSV